VNKTAASATQLAKCILPHAYSCTTANFQLGENKQKLHTLLSNWSNSIFGYKLRTIEAKNPSKVKNSEPQLKIYWFL